jgi:hypothetical protein
LVLAKYVAWSVKLGTTEIMKTVPHIPNYGSMECFEYLYCRDPGFKESLVATDYAGWVRMPLI